MRCNNSKNILTLKNHETSFHYDNLVIRIHFLQLSRLFLSDIYKRMVYNAPAQACYKYNHEH